MLAMTLVGQTATCQTVSASNWKTFSNRAGWSIKHPSQWTETSCHACDDPSDPNAFVFLADPSTGWLLMVERLKDKPAARTGDEWLRDISRATVLVPVIDEVWITVAGERALQVRNGSKESNQSENTYLVHGEKTFALRASPLDKPES